MTTLAQAWVDRARSYLLTGTVTERNLLASDYTAGSGTLTFTYDLAGITAGSRVSIGLNTFYVWSVNSATKTATVTGGQEGTSDSNANSGAVVYVRPRFTDYELFTAVNEELGALSAPQNGLYQVKTFDLTYNPAVEGYDLTGITDLQAIYEVRAQAPGPAKDWPRVPSHLVRLDRSALVSDFASGAALKILAAEWSGYDVRMLYKAPLTTLTDLTSDTATSGISAQAADIPPLGAAIRMMVGREVKRNFTEAQPDTRRATEVPPGAVLNSYRGLQIQYAQRIAQEASRLAALYPALVD